MHAHEELYLHMHARTYVSGFTVVLLLTINFRLQKSYQHLVGWICSLK